LGLAAIGGSALMAAFIHVIFDSSLFRKIRKPLRGSNGFHFYRKENLFIILLILCIDKDNCYCFTILQLLF
jgi:hypothetical protein